MDKEKIPGLRRLGEQITFKDIAGILCGALLMAIEVQFVLVPARLLTGGVTGIAIILNFFTGYPVWIYYVILNIPIFIAGYRYISRRFAVYSVLGTLGLSFFLGLAERIKWYPDLQDPLLSALLGGVLGGLAVGIILRSKGSSGGTDIIAVIVKRFWGYSFAETSFTVNLMVIILSLVTTNMELTLYSAISIFVGSRVVEAVESGLNISRTIIIVSEQAGQISNEIINNLHRGCTYLKGEGVYSHENRNIIMTTVSRTQLPRLKEIVYAIDAQAFMTVTPTIEVYGKGFKSNAPEF